MHYRIDLPVSGVSGYPCHHFLQDNQLSKESLKTEIIHYCTDKLNHDAQHHSYEVYLSRSSWDLYHVIAVDA